MKWRDLFALPRRVAEIHQQMGSFMADVSPILTQLAQDLRSFASGPFAALLAENVSLRTERDEARQAAVAAGAEAETLRAEDAAETSAATDAVQAFNELANPVTASPEVPVEIPPVDVPTDTEGDTGTDPLPAA